jgi:uncharacterized tellurite resistance protein B-like protein
MSFQTLTRFLKNTLSSPSAPAPDHQEAIQTATAVILLEIAYADNSLSVAEEQRLLEFLKARFAMTDERARELLEAAEGMRTQTIDHWNLTNLIRTNTSLTERIEIVKTMWRLVYEDGGLHQYENYLVRKLADLLGLEHHVMIEAKMAVRSDLGLT